MFSAKKIWSWNWHNFGMWLQCSLNQWVNTAKKNSRGPWIHIDTLALGATFEKWSPASAQAPRSLSKTPPQQRSCQSWETWPCSQAWTSAAFSSQRPEPWSLVSMSYEIQLRPYKTCCVTLGCTSLLSLDFLFHTSNEIEWQARHQSEKNGCWVVIWGLGWGPETVASYHFL